MPVTDADIDLHVPGRGRDREYWLNVILKLLRADIATALGGGSGGSSSAAMGAALAALAAAAGEVEQPLFVPGQRGSDGAAGSAGATGPAGPPGVAFPLFEVDDPAPAWGPNRPLGTAAYENVGSSGHNLPFLDVQNTFSANQLIVKAAANFNIVASSGDATAYVAAVSGSAATFRLTHWTGAAVSDRWLVGKDAVAESGADAGSNLDIYYYDDAGAFKGLWLTGSRVDGSATFAGGGVTASGVTGGARGAATANFTTLYEAGVSLADKYARRDAPFGMFLSQDDGGGGDGGSGLPGQRGADGAAGATGAQGPMGLPLWFLAEDGVDGEPGPPGTTIAMSVIENRTSDPGAPVSGQIWLRTDL